MLCDDANALLLHFLNKNLRKKTLDKNVNKIKMKEEKLKI